MTRNNAERQEAIEQLRKWIKPGDTVYTILESVSRSGMSRVIRTVLLTCEDGQPRDLHPNWAVGKALGIRHAKRNGREQEGLVIGGCGMDMGFSLVYELSSMLYGNGYACLGKGQCPSNYHRNYRNVVSCSGGQNAEGEYVPCFLGDVYRLRTGVGDAFGLGEVCPTCKGKGGYLNLTVWWRYRIADSTRVIFSEVRQSACCAANVPRLKLTA